MDGQYNTVAKALGVLILVGLVWGGYKYLTRSKAVKTKNGETSSTLIDLRKEREKFVEEQTRITVPETGEKAILSDVSGGEGVGVARRVGAGNNYEIEVVANLPDLTDGSFYEGWLVKGQERLSLGRLQLAKAGHLVTKGFDRDVSSYADVVVSLESKSDGVMEKKVLEGRF